MKLVRRQDIYNFFCDALGYTSLSEFDDLSVKEMVEMMQEDMSVWHDFVGYNS